MKTKIKRILRPAYRFFVKSDMSDKKRNTVRPSSCLYIKNNKMIWEVDERSGITYTLTIAGKRYTFHNGKAKLPLTGEMMKAVRDKDYSMKLADASQSTVFQADELEIKRKPELLKIEDAKYLHADKSYVMVELCRDDRVLQLEVKRYGTEASSEEIRFLLVDRAYHLLQSEPVREGRAVVQDVDTLLGEHGELQFIFVSGAYFLQPAVKPFCDNSIVLRTDFSRLYLKQSVKSYVYPAKGLDEKISDLKPKYIYIDSVSYESRKNELEIKLKNEQNSCRKLTLYLRSLKTNERELVREFDVQEQIVIDQLDVLLNREINLLDRYALEFEIKNESGKVLEKNWLKIIQPKKRNIHDYILYNAHGNQLSFIDKHTLIIENEKNHFTYEEKYDFDLENHTFSTDCTVVPEESGKIRLELKIYSLLSKIKGYTIYLTDNYTKKTYYLCERTLPKTDRIVEDAVSMDMDVLKDYLYYNARLNFRIGIEYTGGYRECGFLTKKRAEYSTEEKYLYKQECAEGMVTAFYLGGNQYNLNLWHTSEDEYEKGVRFQIGREKYFETLKNEDVDKKLVMFEANLGKNYTGNPKYLYEYMIHNPEYSDFKFVWAYPDTESDRIPANPILVERGSADYFYYLAKAGYWVNNIRFPVNEKRDETVYLQTWHGTPLKKLGFDIECEGPEKQAFGGLYKESQNWDYLLVDNDYGEEKLVNAFRFKKTVIKEGYPINDIFYREELNQAAEERLYRQYPAVSGRKVILYAPTWRDLQGDYVRGYDFSLPFDVEQLYERFGGEYVILVKLHHLVADSLVIDEKYKDFLINVSREEDVMELLCITDVLITDYSSVFYDFASAKKPILFYAYDLDEYINETRGLYVGMDTLPGPIIKDSESLVEALANIGDYEYDNFPKLQTFCNEMAKYCNGQSCRKVLDIVLNDKKGEA